MHRDPNLSLNSLQVAEMGRLVETYFASIHQGVTVNGYDVTFEDGTHGGLGNLAQTLAQADREEWQAAIATHFETLANSPDRPATWDQASPLVRLRLYPVDAFPPDSRAVTWPVSDDLVAVLMIDSADSASSVSQVDLTDWHVKLDMAFDRALHNTVELEAFEENSQEIEPGASLHFITGDFYTSTRLLVLERHLEDAVHGAVVSVPNRQVMLFHPIKDLGVVPVVNTMIVSTNNFYDQGPGSISPSLYWWRPTAFVPLPSSFDGTRVEFAPPEEFVEMLNGLAPAEKDTPKRGFFKRGSD